MPRRVVTRQRRPHRKSHNGCGSCKALRVKCDEQGPPCRNCSLRQLDCRYPKGPRARPGRAVRGPGAALKGGPARGGREMLELELMHRWCTRTYAGILFSDHEYAFATVELPRAALSSDMLLSYLFASAALDLASTQASEARALDYTSLAMDYYDRAVGAYRGGVGRPSRETHWMYSALGLYMTNFHLGFMRATGKPGDSSPGQLSSLLEAVRAAFAMMHSAALAPRRYLEWFFRMPYYPFDVFACIARDPAPVELLSEATRASFDRLRTLNAKRHPGARAEARPLLTTTITPADQPDPAHPPPPSVEAATYQFYERNIAILERLWAEEARGLVRANFWFFPPRALSDKPAGCQLSEDMELVILLHWAVLLHQSSSYYWWVGETGTKLMAACCDALRRMPISQEPEVKENMAWVWLQVGIPRSTVSDGMFSGKDRGDVQLSSKMSDEVVPDRASRSYIRGIMEHGTSS